MTRCLRLVRIGIATVAPASLALLIGCAATAPPSSDEMSRLKRGDRTLMLARVALRNLDGKALAPFPESLAVDNVGIGLGGFETGGNILQVSDLRFLSDESRSAGWFFVLVSRGTQYLVFRPPQNTDAFSYAASFNRAQRWRVDASTTAEVVYAGTFIASAQTTPLLFGGEGIMSLDFSSVRDESDMARSLVKRWIPGVSTIDTALMVKHSGPVIFNTPTR